MYGTEAVHTLVVNQFTDKEKNVIRIPSSFFLSRQELTATGEAVVITVLRHFCKFFPNPNPSPPKHNI